MRAVNLVPPESRAGKVSAGKSGGAVYGVIGALVLALVMLSLLALTKREKASAEQELAGIQQSTQAYEQVATQFSSFESAAKQANERIDLVRSLAGARFDWAGTLRDMARLIPRQTQIQTLDASVRDGANAGGGSSTFRSQIGMAPAITLKGCTKTQGTVADLVTRLQAMRRVTNVTLEQSETDGKLQDFDKRLKPIGEIADSSGSSSSSDAPSATAEDCSLPKPYYGFTITVFYAGGKAQASADAIPSVAGAGSGTTISSETAGATTPASTTPAAGN